MGNLVFCKNEFTRSFLRHWQCVRWTWKFILNVWPKLFLWKWGPYIGDLFSCNVRLKWILKGYLFLLLFLLILAGSFPVDEVLNLSEKKAHGLSLTVVIFFLALCSILNLYQPTGDYENSKKTWNYIKWEPEEFLLIAN